MATAAQIFANRENARHSTGPKTEEGKAKSSSNSYRHGLAAHGLIILPGQEEAFNDLHTGLHECCRPEGTLQETIFMRILESAWHLHRCRVAESQLYLEVANQGLDPMLDEETQTKYAR